jgi:hypothetical protein
MLASDKILVLAAGKPQPVRGRNAGDDPSVDITIMVPQKRQNRFFVSIPGKWMRVFPHSAQVRNHSSNMNTLLSLRLSPSQPTR